MNNQAEIRTHPQESETSELVTHRLRIAAPGHPTPDIDHWVLQLWGIPPERINHPDVLKDLLNSAVEELRLTRVSDHSHFFGPGVSTVIILSESHLSAHTWPELGYIHVDVVTCFKKLNHGQLEAVFRRRFSPGHIQVAQLKY